jgi:hypothetical protein
MKTLLISLVAAVTAWSQTPVPRPPIINAILFSRAWVNSSDAHRAQYTNRLLTVIGTVVRSGTDELDRPFVVLGNDPNGPGVQCCFERGSNATEQMAHGKQVAITGRVNGSTKSLILTECHDAQPAATSPPQ